MLERMNEQMNVYECKKWKGPINVMFIPEFSRVCSRGQKPGQMSYLWKAARTEAEKVDMSG